MPARATTPPITPPAIAPVLVFEKGSLGAVVGLKLGANVGIDLVAERSKAEYVLPK